MSGPHLVLASASPRRRELLQRAGVEIICDPPHCDETWHPGEAALDYVARVAQLKARAVFESRGQTRDQGSDLAPLILAADTTVWIPGPNAPIGKPEDRAQAKAGLLALTRAQMHQVSTAFCLLDAHSGALKQAQSVSTKVWMRTPTQTELESYLDTQEWQDKAGGYGIQGAAAGLVTRLEGSYTNVVGLPLAEVLAALEL